MKNLIILLLFHLSFNALSQGIDTIIVDFNGNHFYHVKGESNSKILIFLHGGVNNPEFNNRSKIHEIDFLLEGNDVLIESALNNNFDLLIPVRNDSLNWLTDHQYCFRTVSDYLDSIGLYTSHYISGFSDGGTGGYKIFYDNNDYFDGLIVFNAYPQHRNFDQRVKYSMVTNKKVIFYSTFDDEAIPYEFLLTEYCKQKESNANTYFYVKDGKHSFDEYGQNEMNILFDILASRINNTRNEQIHAFIKNDEVVEFYTFRKKIYNKFAYGKEFLEANKEQEKLYRNR